MKTLSTISEQKYQDLQQRVSDRTVELAKLAGRAPHQIKQSDYEQAKREICASFSHSVRQEQPVVTF